ncbi:T9SS type A sorting domain-containing protein [bacterium]|nr:T9SS type A sorting domain-containing protein [bacterium]
MWGTRLVEWLPGVANGTVSIGIYLLIQSTVILSVGLGAAYGLRKRGAALQSIILRIFLIAVFLGPPVSFILKKAGILEVTVYIPRIPGNALKKDSSAALRTVGDMPSRPEENPLKQSREQRREYNRDTGIVNSTAPETVIASPEQSAETQRGEKRTDKPVSSAPQSNSPGTPQLSQRTGLHAVQDNPERTAESGAGPTAPVRATKTRMLAGLYIAGTLAWFAWTFFLLVRLLGANLYIQYIRRSAFQAKTSHSDLCRAVSGELGIAPPQVLRSPLTKTPLLTGVLSPVIIMPVHDFDSTIPMEDVFYHELSHLKRRDPLWNQLRQIATALLPFQPLLWVLSHWIEEMSDYVCDDFVLNHGKSHKSYAYSLAHIAESFQVSRPERAAGVGFISFKSSLQRRILRILDRSRRLYLRVSTLVLVLISSLSLISSFFGGLIGIKGKPMITESQASENPDYTMKELRIKGEQQPQYTHPADDRTVLSDAGNDSEIVSRTITESGDIPAEQGTPSEPSPVSVIESRKIISAIDFNEDSHSENLDTNAEIKVTGKIAETAGTDTGGARAIVETGTDRKESGRPKPDNRSADVSNSDKSALRIQLPQDFRPGDKSSIEQVVLEPELTGGEPDLVLTDFEIHDPGYSLIGYDYESNTTIEPGKVNVITRWDKKQYEYTNDLTARDELEWYLSRGQKYPVLSPDGSVIAFTDWSGCGIWTLPVKDYKPSLAYSDTKLLKSEEHGFEYTVRGQHKQPICFTPDGKEITFRDELYDESRGSRALVDESGHLRSTSGYIPVIRSVNLETGACRTIAEEASSGCWHPDGRFFIYTRTRTGATGDRQTETITLSCIMVLDTVTGKERMLAENAHSPSVTPSGSHVIYVENYSDNPQLFRIPFEGGESEQLTMEGYWHQPSCTPDGKWVMSLVYDSTLPYEKDTWFRAVNLENGDIRDFYPTENFVFAAMGNFLPDGTGFCYHLLKNWENDEYKKYDCHLYIGEFSGSGSEKPVNTDEIMPLEFALKGNYPNPFNMSTTIEFVLDTDGPVTVEVFNITGQRIRTLVEEPKRAGLYKVQWDGNNDNRQRAASGTYIARLRMGSRMKTHRMALVK